MFISLKHYSHNIQSSVYFRLSHYKSLHLSTSSVKWGYVFVLLLQPHFCVRNNYPVDWNNTPYEDCHVWFCSNCESIIGCRSNNRPSGQGIIVCNVYCSSTLCFMDIYRRLSKYTNRVQSCHEVDCLK